jgi:hypothetical protein
MVCFRKALAEKRRKRLETFPAETVRGEDSPDGSCLFFRKDLLPSQSGDGSLFLPGARGGVL